MILLILLILLFFLVVLHLSTQSTIRAEGFDINPPPLSPTVLDAYQRFVDFYNPFLVNWEKALTTAVSLDIPVAPMATPDSPAPPSSPPPITRIQMNEYVNRLSDNLKQPLPFVADPLPRDITLSSLSAILPQMPTDMTPYQNAMTWMNQQMRTSQDSLASALQGIPPLPAVETVDTVEGFDATASTCQEMTQCLATNPAFIAQVSQQVVKDQEEQQNKSAEDQQKELLNRITPFLQSAPLSQATTTNQDLAKQLAKVQQQAQSGELFQQINLPDKEPDAPVTLPSGGLALSTMEQTNPQQYNQLKDNYKQWFDVKQLIEQINKSL
jgi:hypothetical protein